jgi:VCBS repeat-containing protein
VSIMVTGLNDAPTANNVNQLVGQNGTLVGNMLASDSDPDTGDTLTVTTVNTLAGNVGVAVAGSGGGLFTLQANGGYLFDTNGAFVSLGAGQSMTTSFTYTIADNHGLAAPTTATVTVTVNGINDGPSAVNDTVLTNAQLGVSQNGNIVSAVNVLANDTDPDTSDVLSVSSIVNAAGSNGGLFSIDSADDYNIGAHRQSGRGPHPDTRDAERNGSGYHRRQPRIFVKQRTTRHRLPCRCWRPYTRHGHFHASGRR